MATSADPRALAIQARRRFLNVLRQGLSQVLLNVEEGAKQLATQPAPPDLLLRRRDAWADLQRLRPALQAALIERLDQRDVQLQNGGFMPTPVGLAHRGAELSLVDDATIEHEILSSRLALAAMDLASFEFTDLRSRMQALERREDLANGDVLRPHVVARDVLEAWRSAGLSLECWRSVQPIVHEELAHLMVLGYHETNKWLIGQGVLPEIDLRPMIRRARDVGVGPSVVGSRGATWPAWPASAARPRAARPPAPVHRACAAPWVRKPAS